jgi:hypothetical protein
MLSGQDKTDTYEPRRATSSSTDVLGVFGLELSPHRLMLSFCFYGALYWSLMGIY